MERTRGTEPDPGSGVVEENRSESVDHRRRGAYLFGRSLPPLVLSMTGLGTILFISAGAFDWLGAWVLLGLGLGGILLNLIVLLNTNPDVIEERLNRHSGAKGWDRIIAAVTAGLWISALVLAGLDRRFGWSPEWGWLARGPAAGLFLLGDLVFLWAMKTNRFFSTLFRIQVERGHRVITDGPYRYVRHPGYVGWILMAAAIPAILGSLWAYGPVGVSIMVMVFRTSLEDRTLQRELEGYSDYARRVRSRLLPGVW